MPFFHEMAPLEVLKSDFDRDRAGYMRRASAEQRVVVRHDASRDVSLVLGGTLFDPRENKDDE